MLYVYIFFTFAPNTCTFSFYMNKWGKQSWFLEDFEQLQVKFMVERIIQWKVNIFIFQFNWVNCDKLQNAQKDFQQLQVKFALERIICWKVNIYIFLIQLGEL
eukprot:TRINITY_DN47544_c0_g1_i1.p4 TRINITY_DN47544_c0_g1~~TRINITY_DN47544_c0_g1_i1.p4  ORF type:complete len:103 (-),score=3.66 TRINITY_DN47544_c0_g1_i1:114-422(-)